jgi:hypothetical protein
MTYETKTTSATPLNPASCSPERGRGDNDRRSRYPFRHKQLQLDFVTNRRKTYRRPGLTNRARFPKAPKQDTPPRNHNHARDPWLLDSERLLAELDRIRKLILTVPLNLDTHFAWQSVLDAIWRLQSTLQWLIQNAPAAHRSCSVKPP